MEKKMSLLREVSEIRYLLSIFVCIMGLISFGAVMILGFSIAGVFDTCLHEYLGWFTAITGFLAVVWVTLISRKIKKVKEVV